MGFRESLREGRFWAKVEKTQTCWLWRGNRTAGGYGLLRVRYRREYAHRFVLGLVGRAVGDGDVVCHRCDVPNCVNPDHLFVGTHADNVADKMAKGRGRNRPSLQPGGLCARGHVLTPDNCSFFNSKGARRLRCRTCHNQEQRSRNAARPAGATEKTPSEAQSHGE